MSNAADTGTIEEINTAILGAVGAVEHAAALESFAHAGPRGGRTAADCSELRAQSRLLCRSADRRIASCGIHADNQQEASDHVWSHYCAAMKRLRR